MKELIGFLGRLLCVYGIPLLALIVASELDLDSRVLGGILIVGVMWMFIFHFLTRRWEDWGSDNKT